MIFSLYRHINRSFNCSLTRRCLCVMMLESNYYGKLNFIRPIRFVFENYIDKSKRTTFEEKDVDQNRGLEWKTCFWQDYCPRQRYNLLLFKLNDLNKDKYYFISFCAIASLQPKFTFFLVHIIRHKTTYINRLDHW